DSEGVVASIPDRTAAPGGRPPSDDDRPASLRFHVSQPHAGGGCDYYLVDPRAPTRSTELVWDREYQRSLACLDARRRDRNVREGRKRHDKGAGRGRGGCHK